MEAPSPIASAIGGVPASNFHGKSFHVEWVFNFADHISSAEKRFGLPEDFFSRTRRRCPLVRTFCGRKPKSRNPVFVHQSANALRFVPRQ